MKPIARLVSGLLLSLLLLPGSVLAGPLSGLSEVGKGQMSWMWFNLYVASLYTADGRYQPDTYPQALQIRYEKDIKAVDLLKATGDEWKKQGVSKAKIQRYLGRLKSLWVDVKPGDTLMLKAESADSGEFYYNGRLLGRVTEPGLIQSFLGIWLLPSTSQPTLRAQLLGDAPCNC